MDFAHFARFLFCPARDARRAESPKVSSRSNNKTPRCLGSLSFTCSRQFILSFCSPEPPLEANRPLRYPQRARFKHKTTPPEWGKSVLIRQVSPHVVERPVPRCTRGVVACTSEEPELPVAIDPVRRIAAATRCPDLVGLEWLSLVAVNAVGATRV